MFSIKELMLITNLSERSIRRYLSEGKINGTKVGGVWRFTQEQIDSFYNNKRIIKDAKREIKSDVLDFINVPNPMKYKTHCCLMVDINVETDAIDKIKKRIMDECTKQKEHMKMKFYKGKTNYHVVLIGDIDFIYNISLTIKD